MPKVQDIHKARPSQRVIENTPTPAEILNMEGDEAVKAAGVHVLNKFLDDCMALPLDITCDTLKQVCPVSS